MNFKKWYSPAFIIFLSFCLFQLGQFYLYGLNIDYANYFFLRPYYMNHIHGDEALRATARYSIICMLAFGTGLCVVKQKKSDSIYLSEKISDQLLINIGWIIFGISLPCVLIYDLSELYIVFTHGGVASAIRSSAGQAIMSRFTIISRIAHYYVPSLILLRLSIDDVKKTKLFNFLMIAHFIVYSFTGQRTVVLAIFLVYLVLSKLKNKETYSHSNSIYVGIGLLAMIILSAYLGDTRSLTDKSFVFSSIGAAIVRFIAECGGSAYPMAVIYSICPVIVPFTFGKAYLAAAVGFFPTFFDFTGTLDKIVAYGNDGWLTEYLGFSYGVGYSLIGESYYNFAWFGFLAILIIGILLGKYMGAIDIDEFNTYSLFKKYTTIVMLFELITLPRRGIFTFFNSLFYDVFVIYIICTIARKRKN